MQVPARTSGAGGHLLDWLLILTAPAWMARTSSKAKPRAKDGLAARLITRLTGKTASPARGQTKGTQKTKPAVAPKSPARKTKPATPSAAPARKPEAHPTAAPRPEASRPSAAPAPPAPPVRAPVYAPPLFSPKAGQPVDSLTPSFRWFYVGGATRYEVEWSKDSQFGRGRTSSIVSSQTAIALDLEHALEPGATYAWRVRGGNDAGWGPWSSAESFRAPDKR